MSTLLIIIKKTEDEKFTLKTWNMPAEFMKCGLENA